MATETHTEQALTPVFRAAAIQRVERSSLRQVAREIGLSPSGLDKFLNGAAPYRKTMRRLQAWYVRGAAAPAGDDHTPSTVAAAIGILASLFPPARREPFVDALTRQLEPVLPSDSSWRQELSSYANAAARDTPY